MKGAWIQVAYETILYEKMDAVGVVTLNRPDKMNTMTPKFFEEYDQVVDRLAADKEVRAVVLKANGKAFSAGGDFELLKELDTATKPLSWGLPCRRQTTRKV